jgi:hypothetical protein
MSRTRIVTAVVAVVVAVVLVVFAPKVALLLLVVFGPPLAAIALTVLGVRRDQTLWPWLAGAGFSLVPACYMGFVSVCSHIAGTCPTGSTLSDSHKAVWAIGLVGLGAIVLIVWRLAFARWLFVACAAVAEIWMFLRLRDVGEKGAAILVALALVGAVAHEVVRHVRAGRAAV